jgi:hypothetical protein
MEEPMGTLNASDTATEQATVQPINPTIVGALKLHATAQPTMMPVSMIAPTPKAVAAQSLLIVSRN